MRTRPLRIARRRTDRAFAVARVFFSFFSTPGLSHCYRYSPFSPIALKHRGRRRGCAALDRSFRSKVKSDTVDVQGTYDPATNSFGGEIRNTLEFRDPKTIR